MTLNQSLIEDNMSDQVSIENKVHIQTLINPDPDFLEQDDKPTIQDFISNHIMFGSNKFSDYCKNNDLQDQIKCILYDTQDDKLGRIRDLFDIEIYTISKFIAEHHKDNNFARWAYEETIKNIV
jgi:hypothetical protein